VYFDGAPPAFGVDFHRSYFNDWLRWAGIEDITELRFQPDLVTDDADGARDAALAAAREAGQRLQHSALV
jgi:FMN-dependent NADH-azoreductase